MTSEGFCTLAQRLELMTIVADSDYLRCISRSLLLSTHGLVSLTPHRNVFDVVKHRAFCVLEVETVSLGVSD